jgi:hypothetical protein
MAGRRTADGRRRWKMWGEREAREAPGITASLATTKRSTASGSTPSMPGESGSRAALAERACLGFAWTGCWSGIRSRALELRGRGALPRSEHLVTKSRMRESRTSGSVGAPGSNPRGHPSVPRMKDRECRSRDS